jgi:hypothetical protein
MSGLIRAVDSNGQAQNLVCNSSKELKVAVSGAGSGGTSSNFGDAFPAAGTAAGFKDSTGLLMSPGNLDAGGNLKVAGTLSTTPASAATSALTNVVSAATSATALAANANRLGMTFNNDADVPCYLKYGTTASASSFTRKLLPGEQWEPSINYTGRVDVIWDATPTGSLRVTELSA